LVFGTKNREKRITEEAQGKLWPYIAGIARNHGFEAIKVGGVEDHAHVLMVLPATIPLAKAIQVLKACSSKWLNETAVKGFFVAGRLWRFQRQRFADGGRGEIHRKSKGTSCEEEFR
jgi:REP element-mobilizing transposase RayT